MGGSKELFGQMREQGHDVDCSGKMYQEPINKCKAVRNPAWGGEEGDWDCPDDKCTQKGECKFV